MLSDTQQPRRTRLLALGLAVILLLALGCTRSKDVVEWDRQLRIADKYYAGRSLRNPARRRQMLESALLHYQRLLRNAPDSDRRQIPLFAVGDTLIRLKRYRVAIRWFWRVLKAEDQTRKLKAKALYRISQIYINNLKDLKTGNGIADRVVLNYPKTAYADLALQQRVRRFRYHKRPLEELLSYLSRVYKRLRYVKLGGKAVYFAATFAAKDPRGDAVAEMLYKRMIAKHKRHPLRKSAYWHLHKLQLKRGATMAAIETLRGLWSLREVALLIGSYEHDRYSDAIFQLGRIYQTRLNDCKKALPWYRLLRSTYAIHLLRDDCLYYIGECQLKLGRRGQAVRTFRLLRREGTEYIHVSTKDKRTGLNKMYKWVSPFLKRARRLMKKEGLGPL